MQAALPVAVGYQLSPLPPTSTSSDSSKGPEKRSMEEEAHLTEMSNDELKEFLDDLSADSLTEKPQIKVTELSTNSPTSLPDNFDLADMSVPQLQELLLNMSASNDTF